MPDKNYFYIEPKSIVDDKFILSKDESFHIVKVLRKQINAEIWLIDGIGTAFKGIINQIKDNTVGGRIIEKYPNYGENEIDIFLGIAILKKDKLDLVIEKATECGVKEIIPLNLDRCIKRNINHARLQKIALAASKQCGRSVIPNIDSPVKIEELLKKSANKTMFVCHDSGEDFVKILNSRKNRNQSYMLLIGPEGDFSRIELKLLNKYGAKLVNLGKRRLRSETAAIAAISQINLYCN